MPSVVRLENVTRFFGNVCALDGLSLDVHEGEIYGFLGRNGAGKSTALQILIGILRPAAGGIEVFGQRVRRVTVPIKQRIGYVSQEPNFYPWMTAEDLGRFVSGFYPTWDAAEFRRLLKLLDVPAGRRSLELSGGTRAKLGLTLALAPRPPLLLLDEPTAGLDPVARREFNDQLAHLQRQYGTTVLFSTHQVAEVEMLAQRLGIIQAGRMCFEGDLATLRDQCRRVTRAAPMGLPEGFERVRGDVLRAGPERWDSIVWPEGTQVSVLPLEDIFLAMARTDGGASGS
jgi:ABC-2 type transport system ATP-binding protein